MASPAIQELTDSLPDGTVIVDADVAAAYSRDRTDVLAAGAPLAVVSARSTDDVARAMA